MSTVLEWIFCIALSTGAVIAAVFALKLFGPVQLYV